jgi:type I restriction enzyme, S subunit
VPILNEAFEGLDRARENVEANLKSAHELFESVLQETLRSKYQIERQVTLGEVCTLSQGLAINKTTKHLLVNKSSKPLLRIKDLRSGSVEKYVAEEGYPAGAEVFSDDIIYTRTGQIGLVFRGFSGVLHNNCFSIRCINGLDRNYCFWWLQERNFRNQIVNLASRAAQPDITHKIFKSQEITLPNEGNQKLAVMSIEDAFNQMQKLQIIYQTKLQDISDLRQSLLQKAFAGELT